MIEKKSFRFDVKSTDTPGVFTGRASVYGVLDAQSDVVLPGAFTKALQENRGRIKVLNQHDPTDVIGMAELSDSELALNATGQLVLELQSAKDAYVRLKNNLIDGISIGYSVPAGGATYVDGARHLKELNLWEISLVTFPANDFARVTAVKTGRFAEFGQSVADELKAGRVLSAANREKIKAAHASMTTATDVLYELLSLTDESMDKAKLHGQYVKLRQARIAIKDIQQVIDAANMVDQMVDALDVAADNLLMLLGAPEPADTSIATDAAANQELASALSSLAEGMRQYRTAAA